MNECERPVILFTPTRIPGSPATRNSGYPIKISPPKRETRTPPTAHRTGLRARRSRPAKRNPSTRATRDAYPLNRARNQPVSDRPTEQDDSPHPTTTRNAHSLNRARSEPAHPHYPRCALPQPPTTPALDRHSPPSEPRHSTPLPEMRTPLAPHRASLRAPVRGRVAVRPSKRMGEARVSRAERRPLGAANPPERSGGRRLSARDRGGRRPLPRRACRRWRSRW